ncbi:Succinate receptor 1 [Bagarius yarrelli]|uniref:Succinate receptor 1 n=1 Tax=Bagarius yarrelli TaxID=175774 RepID=A0A556UY70_BAGYA|nr:Succinate receptor 1 [Bagarius yarrelli]
MLYETQMNQIVQTISGGGLGHISDKPAPSLNTSVLSNHLCQHLSPPTLKYVQFSMLVDRYSLKEDNCSTLITPLLEKHYLSPMYGLEFAIGFIGNLVVVLGYIFCLPAWKSTNVYLFNLSLSDLVFLCTLPELSYNYAYNLKKFNTALCMINRYILHVNLYSSILFMMWVSVDRFLLLCHPQREHILLTLKAAFCITIVNWIWVNAQIAPLIVFIIQDLEENRWTVCRDFASLGVAKVTLIYSVVLTITGYVMPLIAIFLASQKMVSVLVKREEVLGTNFQRPVKIVRSAAIMFLLLYTPIHVMRNVRIASRLPELKLSQCTVDYINAAYIVTRPIGFAHSAVNPVFYFLMTDSFKEALQDKFRQIKRMLRRAA